MSQSICDKQSLGQPIRTRRSCWRWRQMSKFVGISNYKDRLNLSLLNAKNDNPNHTVVFPSDRSRQTVDWQMAKHLRRRTEFCGRPNDQPGYRFRSYDWA